MLYNGQVAIGAFIFATILVVFNALLVQQGDESINGGGNISQTILMPGGSILFGRSLSKNIKDCIFINNVEKYF